MGPEKGQTGLYLQIGGPCTLDHVDVGAHELAQRGVVHVQVGGLRVHQALRQLLHQQLQGTRRLVSKYKGRGEAPRRLSRILSR